MKTGFLLCSERLQLFWLKIVLRISKGKGCTQLRVRARLQFDEVFFINFGEGIAGIYTETQLSEYLIIMGNFLSDDFEKTVSCAYHLIKKKIIILQIQGINLLMTKYYRDVNL